MFIGAGPVGVVLAASAFEDGPAATSPSDRIIYNEGTGAIYYDRDGTGPARQIQFATLVGSPNDVDNCGFSSSRSSYANLPEGQSLAFRFDRWPGRRNSLATMRRIQ